MALFLASLFAAIRFQTGGDWEGYELYYEAINTDLGLIEAYLSDPLMLQFEPGYYFVSYATKMANAPYEAVNAISVFTLFLTFVFFLRKTSIPPYFVVLVFLGLPLMSLFYNQVRQSMAIAFVLLAIQSKSSRSFFVFCCFALLFQFSTIIFIAVAFVARHFVNTGLKIFPLALLSIPAAALVFVSGIVDPYEVLRFLLPESLKFKIDIYEEEETSFGALRLVTIGYLLFVASHLLKKARSISTLTTLEKQILVNALLCTLLIPYSLVMFPNSYAFFGRALVFSLILLSISGAILHRQTLRNRQAKRGLLPMYGLGALSFAYYFTSLYVYSDVYLPYKSTMHI